MPMGFGRVGDSSGLSTTLCVLNIVITLVSRIPKSTNHFSYSWNNLGLGQAINHLGTPGGRTVFWKGPKIFNYSMSNSFIICPTQFSREGEKFSRGDLLQREEKQEIQWEEKQEIKQSLSCGEITFQHCWTHQKTVELVNLCIKM